MATWPTVTDDNGSGTTGTILDNTFFTSVQTYIGAAWTTPTFSAGNFTANGAMTWTVDSGDVLTYSYVVIGKTMMLSWYISTTDVGGTANNELRIAIPGGATAQKTTRAPHWLIDAGGSDVFGLAQAGFGNAYVSLFRPGSANWTLTSSDNTWTAGQIAIEIA